MRVSGAEAGARAGVARAARRAGCPAARGGGEREGREEEKRKEGEWKKKKKKKGRREREKEKGRESERTTAGFAVGGRAWATGSRAAWKGTAKISD